MGFEYIYAYLENLQWFFIIGTGILSIALIWLIIGRVTNDIDADDWKLMMLAAVPALFIFIFFDLSPSMDHIRKVKTETSKPFVEPTTLSETIDREEKNETPKPTYYPSAYCTNSLMCSGK